MQSRIEDIRGTDAELVAVCVDPVTKNAEVVRDLKLSFPILFDEDLSVVDTYDIRHAGGNGYNGSDIARPAIFVLDRKGVVQWRELTDNYRVRVSPETILEQLAAVK